MGSPIDEALRQARFAVDSVRKLRTAPNAEQFARIASSLKRLAISAVWRDSGFRGALPGEELVSELAVAPGSVSLYLVSDGIGTSSPPHGHETWAVIAGIRGRELNILYR